jgi:hypothetical protein
MAGPTVPKATVLRGVNVDPTNQAPGAHPDPRLLVGRHFNAVRLVCKPGGDAERYAEAAVKAGMYVLGIITAESQGQLLYNCHAYELRNEIDIASASSEGIMDPAVYAGELQMFTGQYPDLKFILGSLAGGDYQGDYFRRLLAAIGTLPPNVIGWSIHPYAKQLSEVRPLIDAHETIARGLLGQDLPCYVTEWNRPVNQIPGFDWYLRTSTAGGFWFCADDAMVPGFGLMHGGRAKPELAAFAAFNPNPTPKPPVPGPAAYTPTVTWDWMSPWDNGAYPATPRGFIVHGSRSGVAHLSTDEEFWGTAHFTKNRQDGLSYQATIGDDIVSMGLPDGHWGWHARGCSSLYVGYELAQPVEAADISDAQVRALVYRMRADRRVWPDIPLMLKTHAEVDGTAEYGGYHDGKSDVMSRGSARWDALRGRILAECARQGLS